jgi:hypothetical protein
VPTESKPLFNHDLLMNPEDVRAARHVFPAIGDVLDWPDLRAAFAPHERAAIHAKRQSRGSGVLALAAALAALWLAVLVPEITRYFPGRLTPQVLTIAVAALATAGLVLASRVLIGARKERWLHHRTATERLRQLHFQFLARRARQIAEGDGTVTAAILEERERTLEMLRIDLRPGMTRPADAIMEDLGGADCWLVDEPAPDPALAARPAVLGELFHAYARLRFQHQADYATKKIAPGIGLWPWEPEGQARRINATAYALTFMVVVCNVLAVAVLALALPGEVWLSVGTQTISMLAATGALALRVLEDGIRPRAEVTRLRNYRGEVLELYRKFEATTDVAVKISLMERLEELSYRELRDFLTLHHEASFVL